MTLCLLVFGCDRPVPPVEPASPPPVSRHDQPPAPVQPSASVEPPPRLLNEVPWGFVELGTLQYIVIEPRYHSADNFTGAPLPGYGAPGAWLDKRAADALASAAEALFDEGYELLIYDAYRPKRATAAMVAWTERTHQEHLISDGYIAARSGHNTGFTVDLTLTREGSPVDMGTPWDNFSAASHTRNASGRALEHRLRLAKAMQGAGFRAYSKEWWHFSWGKSGNARDVPYGCFEPAEGAWSAPANWTDSSYKAPASWTATSCSP